MQSSTILIVDDTPDNLTLMSGLLKGLYRVKVATRGERAIKLATSGSAPDLILLDIMMPEMDGYEVCRRLKADDRTSRIPIIFLTAKSEIEDETRGLELGAVDYITKPISPPIVLARVKTQIALKRAADFLRDQNAYLEAEVRRRTAEVTAVQEVTIHALASLAETRDSDTGNHIRRTKYFVRLLAEKVRDNPRFSDFLDEQMIDVLFKSAPLHDIGKVGIPDKILLKPGRFEPHEFEVMKTHTTLGQEAIVRAEQELGLEVPFLKHAKDIALYHQEKWDGTGYPEGLAGEQIPISARIMAVADVYDALVSRRVYKKAMSHEKAVGIMIEGKGKHFDPDLIDAFLELQEEFQDISQRYADSDQELAGKAEQLSAFHSPDHPRPPAEHPAPESKPRPDGG
jgi:cyclic di-GMP phosphodiesterase